MTDRSNLLYNPSFQYGLNGWASRGGAGLVIRQGVAFYGDQCLVVDISAVQNRSGAQQDQLIALVHDDIGYSASAYVQIPATTSRTAPATLVIRFNWYDALGEKLDSPDEDELDGLHSDSVPVTIYPGDGWIRLSHHAIPPIGAAAMTFSVIQVDASKTDDLTYFFLDACLLEHAQYASGYTNPLPFSSQKSIIDRSLTPYQEKTVGTFPLRADVVLDNLVLNTIDENNVVWVCTDIDGWWGHSTPEGPDIERGFEDGSYDVTGRYQARSLTLSGTFLPPSPDDMPKARDMLVAATNLVRRGAWLRTSENPTRAAFVRLGGRPKIDTVNARGRTNFEIPLRAADPAKYHWNDLDPDGYTVASIDAVSNVGEVTNIGTSDVTAIFRFIGPMGKNSTVTNETTGETITLARELRRAADMAKVTWSEMYDGTAMLQTERDSGLYEGDLIAVTGVGGSFNTDSAVVVSASREDPFRVVYKASLPNGGVPADVPLVKSSGTISLIVDDVLDIDTYQKSVSFNNVNTGQRDRVATKIDWIKLAPGDNAITLDTQLAHMDVIKKDATNGVITLTTATPHQIRNGDSAKIVFPTKADLSEKELDGTNATVSTVLPHGFSVGDTVSITTVSEAVLNHKAVDSATGIVTMTTDAPDGGVAWDFKDGDQITIDIPYKANILRRAYDGTDVTLTTDVDHGFVIDDQVEVILPTKASITQKSLTNGVVTLTFGAPHNFSLNDYITVDLPNAQTTASSRMISGANAIITTTAAHNFSTNDLVSITLPTAVTLASTATYSGAGPDNYKATLTTTTPHNFVVGDVIRVAITNGSSTNASVYNGDRIIETVTATTLTFTSYGPDGASTDTIGGGTVTNLTNAQINGINKQIVVTSPTQFTVPITPIT